MLEQIEGIHHITSLARDAVRIDRFFTRGLGLRRVKKTVNFDAPDVYHLYYGNQAGEPGSAMTYFPFPHAARGSRGAGEVGTTVFAVPEGSLDFWQRHLEADIAGGLARTERFDEVRLAFEGPDGDGFALVEQTDDPRLPWTGGGIEADHAIRGFHSASLTLADTAGAKALLEFMGFVEEAVEGNATRMARRGGNAARFVDLVADPNAPPARQGAGSVHHIAFATADAAAQNAARAALAGEGFGVTPVIDRDYFLSIYFRAPGGVLFEIATNDPGFARDEDPGHLGEALKLPRQHAHLRAQLERHLPALGE